MKGANDMKKRMLAAIALTLMMLSTGCADDNLDISAQISDESEQLESVSSEAEESLEADTKSPVIRIAGANAVIVIKKGDEVDLMKNVTGRDDRDGNITDKITVDKGGFDSKTPGEYTVTYSLKDSAGNSAEDVTRTVIVRETDVLKAPPIYDGSIDGEVLNPNNPKVFGGAWYHKVVSSRDKWLGIEATVTLPEYKIRRYKDEYDITLNADPNVKNLDNPSVYMGGNAESESDVGLSLSLVLLDVANKKISTGCYAFRPFWRYITSDEQDLGSYEEHNGEYQVSAVGNNCSGNYHWKYTEYYYLPGDTIRMIIVVPAPNKMQLQIEVISKSTLPESVAIRERYGWKDPENFISPIFTSPGHGVSGVNAEFKRVNAIDQSGNEGKTAIDTATVVSGAVWHDTYLYREIDGVIYRVPMNDSRRGVVSAPDSSKFTVSYDNVDSNIGGEVVTIHPGYSN